MDGELNRRAKAAGQAFNLFKAQLAREGHKIRGDVDFTTMEGISVAAEALRDSYLKEQEALDEYARSGGFQGSLSLEDGGEGEKPKKGRKPSESRGISSEIIQTCEGALYRATTSVHENGVQLAVQEIDFEAMPLRQIFEKVYLSPEDAWNEWDDMVKAYNPEIKRQNGSQEIGGKEFIFTVQSKSVDTGTETETSWYFEIVGDKLETNGTRSSAEDAWNAIDLWAMNRFGPKVIEGDLPKPPEAKHKAEPAPKTRTRKPKPDK